MGSDKSMLQYYDLPQYQHVVRILEPLVEKVFISVRKQQRLNYPNIIMDKYDDIGPFGGILTALETYPEKSFLVLAVDMPMINEENLKLLITERDLSVKATAFYDVEKGFPEPLACIWESSVLTDLQDFYQKKIYKPIQVLKTTVIKTVSINEFYLQNINTYEEFITCKKNIQNSRK